jgi:hypothetical protein
VGDAGEQNASDARDIDALLREVARAPVVGLLSGARLLDRFVVKRRLGAGGMGIFGATPPSPPSNSRTPSTRSTVRT